MKVEAENEVIGRVACAGWTLEEGRMSAIVGPADKVALTLGEGAAGALVEGFAIRAADAKQAGGSSIGVVVAAVQAELAEVEVTAGNGQDGARGTTPEEAPLAGASAGGGSAQDHTLLEDLLRGGHGSLHMLEALSDRASAVTRALGCDESVAIESRVEAILPDDVFLVCSDGWWGPVPAARIAGVLRTYRDLRLAASLLVDLANEHRGPDNVTACWRGSGAGDVRGGGDVLGPWLSLVVRRGAARRAGGDPRRRAVALHGGGGGGVAGVRLFRTRPGADAERRAPAHCARGQGLYRRPLR
ncbi:PP2C family protein-serine/threonine phosphatase [Sorangium sp. So ce1389]|uniref:PP2C family protein-serine/threonine phosphatase n=1 Tax=Sorangium sp. So ce1389 TaxID=3133336 RepID=UPI003F5FAB09